MSKPDNLQCDIEETRTETTDENDNKILHQWPEENKGFCFTYSVKQTRHS